MSACRVLKKGLRIVDEMHVSITLVTVSTIGGLGGCKPAPELRTREAQQTADVGFLIPDHLRMEFRGRQGNTWDHPFLFVLKSRHPDVNCHSRPSCH